MSQSTIKNKSKGTTNMNSANTVADMNKLVEVDINEELEKNESENEDNNDVVDSEEDADDDELDDELELDDEVDDDELDEESDDDAEEVDDDVDDAEDDEREDDDEVEDDDGDSKKASKLNKKTKKSSKAKGKMNNISGIEMLKATKKTAPVILDDDDDNDNDDDDDDMNELYLQKFDNELRENYIVENHAESKVHNYEEVKALSRVVRDGRGIIVDPLHKTNPILTKYEMTRVLGQRAKQLDSGAKAFVKVPLNVIDGYFIAMIELEQKKIPFIIKRPLPNGGVEYWNVSDLEILI